MAMLFIYLSIILKIRFWYGMCMCVGVGGGEEAVSCEW